MKHHLLTRVSTRTTLTTLIYSYILRVFGNRQMVDILTAVLTDGLPADESACAEAIAQGVHPADVVLNILARQRDPGPPSTILTPAGLTLRHAPVADCARYDNLRRTI